MGSLAKNSRNRTADLDRQQQIATGDVKIAAGATCRHGAEHPSSRKQQELESPSEGHAATRKLALEVSESVPAAVLPSLSGEKLPGCSPLHFERALTNGIQCGALDEASRPFVESLHIANSEDEALLAERASSREPSSTTSSRCA